MDLRKFAVAETSTLELVDGSDLPLEDDQGNRASITLYGPGSKQYTKATAGRNNRTMDRLRKKGKADLTPEQLIAEQAEFLATCTKSFQYIEMDSLTGHELFKAVYGEASIGFVAEQASAHLGEWGNFTKPAQAV